MAQGDINMNDDLDRPKLGACCTCGTMTGVRNIMLLDRRAPVAGTGWGCAVCQVPNDGAIAVLCDECTGLPTRTICVGYPGENKRIPLDELPDEPFGHHLEFHQGELGSMN